MREIMLVVFVVGWAGSVVFPVYYHLTAKWWDTRLGQHLMGYSVVVALALTNSLIRIFWPQLDGRVVTARIFTVLIAIIVWWRVYVYWKERKEYKKNGGTTHGRNRTDATPGPTETTKPE